MQDELGNLGWAQAVSPRTHAGGCRRLGMFQVCGALICGFLFTGPEGERQARGVGPNKKGVGPKQERRRMQPLGRAVALVAPSRALPDSSSSVGRGEEKPTALDSR